MNDTNKIFYSMVGLPRSGTTIFTNVLNGFKDTFCLSEPIWTLMESPSTYNSGKIDGELMLYTPDSVMSKTKKFLEESRFKMGGFKETYRAFQKPNPIDKVDQEDHLLDLKIFIVREPRCNFAGWLRKPFLHIYKDIDVFISNYESFFNYIDSYKGKKLIFKYEEISKEYILKKLAPYYKADEICVEPTGFSYGDQKANNSKVILKPNMSFDLTVEQVEKMRHIIIRYEQL